MKKSQDRNYSSARNYQLERVRLTPAQQAVRRWENWKSTGGSGGNAPRFVPISYTCQASWTALGNLGGTLLELDSLFVIDKITEAEVYRLKSGENGLRMNTPAVREPGGAGATVRNRQSVSDPYTINKYL